LFANVSRGHWNGHKTEPAFSDMVAALRRAGGPTDLIQPLPFLMSCRKLFSS
jgi:hypothetical protein